MKFAIAQPELPGFARIIALVESAGTPEALSPFIAIRLRGYYTAGLGELTAYGTWQGVDGEYTYSEVEVDTSGT